MAGEQPKMPSYFKERKLAAARTHEISIVNDFKHGYRNREDITNLPAGVLVVGSQDVLVNTASRVQCRQGYVLDGIPSTVNAGIKSSFEWYSKGNGSRYTRAGFLTSAANDGKLQFRYANTSGTVGVTISVASPAVFKTGQNHGLSVGDTVIFATTGALPTGLTAGTTYYVISAGLTTTAFEVSATSGGSAINTSGTQSGTHTVTVSTVIWIDLLSSLTTVSYNFTTLWDTTELIRLLLFVNGTSNVFEWNGAYGKVASVTTNTIVMADPIATSGFYSTRNRVITVSGVDYTYTGISGSTFTGVTPDPTAQTRIPQAGDIAFQKVITTANSTFTNGPSSTFANDLVSSLNNQLYIASLTRPDVYVSKQNSYVDYSFSTPRIPGEGALAHLDDNIVGFVPQEDVMYITAGKDFWYNTKLTQSSSYNGTGALIIESFDVKLLKVNNLQAAQSQSLVGKAGNDVIFVQNEPAFLKLGRIENILGTPQTAELSDSVKNDFDGYDFTGGSVYSWRRYLLCTVPVSGIVRIYNLTTKAWEAPQNLPITSFYTVAGQLYGHSSVTSESYHLFSGYSDRTIRGVGSPIKAIASFSYQNYGTRTTQKNCNEFYIEGYINANTTLNCEIDYELDGCMSSQVFSVDGSDKTVVCIPSDESSLGKVSFGKEKFGGDRSSSLTGLPPKFRVIKTFNRVDFYEHQFSFSIFGKDQRFELLAFGTNSMPSSTTNAAIKQ